MGDPFIPIIPIFYLLAGLSKASWVDRFEVLQQRFCVIRSVEIERVTISVPRLTQII